MGLYGAVWGHLGLFGALWGHLGPFGAIWGRLGLYGAIWGCLGLYGAVWGRVGSPQVEVWDEQSGETDTATVLLDVLWPGQSGMAP